jgi:hypothetical protein
MQYYTYRKGIVLFLSTIAVVLFFYRGKGMKNDKMLRVAFPRYNNSSYYDPVKIQFATEYIFLENIFSPLVEYSTDGQLVSGVAGKFYWKGTDAYFEIRSDLKTIDGKKIDAYDVELSLKRLLILGGNTHGDLKSLICPNDKITKLTDTCSNMEVKDNGKTLVIKFKEIKPFIFPMLAAIDFAIIPKDSIDLKTLKIIDYRNTSGPYYVKKDDPEGNIILSANPFHYHYSKNMPQEVHLIPSAKKNRSESLDLFLNNKVDHITTTDKVYPVELIHFASQHKGINIHSTYPIHLYLVAFTTRGLKRFSDEERIKIGEAIKNLFLFLHSNEPEYKPVNEIFPVFGEGSLNKEQVNEVINKYNNIDEKKILGKKIVGWDLYSAIINKSEILKKILPRLKLISIHKIPGLVNYELEKIEEPDFSIRRCDVGFQEDIGLLSYYFSTDFFYLRGEEGKKWLEKYTSIPLKEERLNILRDLHYKTLITGSVVPIAMTPYAAIVRKPWKINFSKYHANNPIWRIQKD